MAGMATGFSIPQFDFFSNGRSLERLLRQKTIQSITRALKIIIYVISLLLLALLGREIIGQTLATSTTRESLKNAVALKLSTLDSSPLKPDSKPQYSSIVNENIFGKIGFESSAPSVAPAKVTPVKSTVPMILIGTYVAGNDPESSYAIIENEKSKSQEVFSIGEEIFDTAILSAIYGDRVEINRNGSIETLLMDDAPDSVAGSGPVADDAVVVDEGELNQALDNLPLLLTQARAVPYFKDGKSVGLRLFAIKSGSLYEKIGLKNGDILKEINGESLGDPTQAIKIFERLKSEKSISLTLERGREPKVINYQIE